MVFKSVFDSLSFIAKCIYFKNIYYFFSIFKSLANSSKRIKRLYIYKSLHLKINSFLDKLLWKYFFILLHYRIKILYILHSLLLHTLRFTFLFIFLVSFGLSCKIMFHHGLFIHNHHCTQLSFIPFPIKIFLNIDISERKCILPFYQYRTHRNLCKYI